MSIHFHKLQVKEVRRETADCVSVVFNISEDIRAPFIFREGQSLTMRTTINGEEVRRTYSICSSPLDNELRVAIKRVDGGLFSSFANESLKAGDILEVMQPVGKFYVDLDPLNEHHYLGFAAGSGITPLLSIIKTTLRSEPKSSFTLVYGNKSRSSIIFFEELEGLKNKYVQRFNLIHILSRERTDTQLNSGRIDHEKLGELSRILPYSSFNEIFICGPEKMLFAVKNFLEKTGISKKKIHFELFTTPGTKTPSRTIIAHSGENEKLSPKSRVTVKVDGRMFDFDLPLTGNTTILDAALSQGADLPFACKGGVCCTCKARLLEGEVRMDVHWGLEDEEIEQGYILTCQSHPVSEKVTVDFDVK